MALSFSLASESDANPEVSIGISSETISNNCVPTPQRIIYEHSALTARPDLHVVDEIPCIVAPPGIPVPLGLCSTSYASQHISVP